MLNYMALISRNMLLTPARSYMNLVEKNKRNREYAFKSSDHIIYPNQFWDCKGDVLRSDQQV